MGIDVSRYKVVYGEKVMQAIALIDIEFAKDEDMRVQYKTPKFIEILAINSDGNIMALRDEAWRFQFIPQLAAGGKNNG